MQNTIWILPDTCWGQDAISGKINTASIPTRYPEDLQSALKDYPEPVVREYLRQTQELILWLKQHPNLSK